jgi:glycosyltransferase involved in cell wall biosynthesis
MNYQLSMNKDPYLSFVIPLYNEEESVGKLVDKIIEIGRGIKHKYELISVDDGSTDGTWQAIEKLRQSNSVVRGIKLRRNYGQTNALVAGFDFAQGEVIVTLDGDLQNDPADIPTLLEKINEGCDIVSGWRKDRKDHWSRVIPSRVANWIISTTTGVQLHDYGCALKAYRAECIKSIKAYGEMHRFFPALASMTGARVTEVPINHHPRKFGVSKYGFDRIFKVFSDIFSMNLIIRFSSMPLKGFAVCSLPFILFTLFFGILGFAAMIFDWTPGKALFFSAAAALSGMAVVHLLLLGVIGELVVNTSDLSHTQMPEITKKRITMRTTETPSSQREQSFS